MRIAAQQQRRLIEPQLEPRSALRESASASAPSSTGRCPDDRPPSGCRCRSCSRSSAGVLSTKYFWMRRLRAGDVGHLADVAAGPRDRQPVAVDQHDRALPALRSAARRATAARRRRVPRATSGRVSSDEVVVSVNVAVRVFSDRVDLLTRGDTARRTTRRRRAGLRRCAGDDRGDAATQPRPTSGSADRDASRRRADAPRPFDASSASW